MKQEFTIRISQEAKDILEAASAGMDRTINSLIEEAINEAVPAMARRFFHIEDNEHEAP